MQHCCYNCSHALPLSPLSLFISHALACARVARDMLEKFHQVTQMLEVSLGPDTGELGLRVGLHSGPVTAGILRGSGGRYQVRKEENCRRYIFTDIVYQGRRSSRVISSFLQLFGDTVNTATCIETTGERDKIHMSKETAEMIQKSGKASWVKPRGEVVTAKVRLMMFYTLRR